MITSIRLILSIALGSALGGVARYLVGKLCANINCGGFPLGTFIVNILGCFILGLIYGLLSREFQLSPEMKAFLTVGLCGGFTTFSTFIHENYNLFNTSSPILAITYITLSIACGLLAAYLAHALVK